jgi:hypothetical protein
VSYIKLNVFLAHALAKNKTATEASAKLILEKETQNKQAYI